MKRSSRDVLPLLSAVAAIALALISCRLGPANKEIATAALDSGSNARISLRTYYDTAALVLDVRNPGKPVRYYLIAGSPDVEFGRLQLTIELSHDKRQLWVIGNSTHSGPIKAAYDDLNGEFYTDDGRAQQPAKSADIETMLFVSAPFPEKSGPASVLFQGFVPE